MTKFMKKSVLALLTAGALSAFAIAPVAFAEGTEEGVVTDEATDEVTDEITDEVTDEISDEITDEVTSDVVTPVAPKTADMNANVAIAVGATAVVAALGIVLVAKKARD